MVGPLGPSAEPCEQPATARARTPVARVATVATVLPGRPAPEPGPALKRLRRTVNAGPSDPGGPPRPRACGACRQRWTACRRRSASRWRRHQAVPNRQVWRAPAEEAPLASEERKRGSRGPPGSARAATASWRRRCRPTSREQPSRPRGAPQPWPCQARSNAPGTSACLRAAGLLSLIHI